MAKQEAKWFKHDQYARRDQKILEMRLVYGPEGYGYWWMLLEMLNEATDYKLRLSGKYSIATMAQEANADPEKLTEFINDCINEFDLFETDGQFFWSASMLRRMEPYAAKCEQNRANINKRWEKTRNNKE